MHRPSVRSLQPPDWWQRGVSARPHSKLFLLTEVQLTHNAVSFSYTPQRFSCICLFFFRIFSIINYHKLLAYTIRWGFPGSSDSKEPACNLETWVQPLGWEDPLEEGMATHSSMLAWRLPTDRGTWRATVCGVTESGTWLSDKAQHKEWL